MKATKMVKITERPKRVLGGAIESKTGYKWILYICFYPYVSEKNY
jgi:hypothetical protein